MLIISGRRPPMIRRTVISVFGYRHRFRRPCVPRPIAKRLHDYRHTRCSWYGPSGIDTARKINGFIDWYQISFFNELPDRVGDPHAGHLFADGNFTAFTAWPGMYMTVSGSGWLGIAPGDQKIYMRSLDFWRVEDDLIRENWVLVDMLCVYDQLVVDVLARMREFIKARR